LPLDRDGFAVFTVRGDGSKEIKEFQDSVKDIYEAANGMLPPGIGLTTFKSVGERLIRAAHNERPTAQVVQSISIGNTCFRHFSEDR
jgi:hypothetical protein